jgi:hypothetical protein
MKLDRQFVYNAGRSLHVVVTQIAPASIAT